jgi:hypothetical protein
MRYTNRIHRICWIGLFSLFIVVLDSPGFGQSEIITTYVGPGLPVNGAQATTQAIDWPGGVAPDGAGRFYLASSYQNRVYRVEADGSLTLMAGLGAHGFSGDGGPATAAQLNHPGDVAIDSEGNLYIDDHFNYRIRKVTVAGVISTVAGNGTQGFGGDGGPATEAMLGSVAGVAVDSTGDLYFADLGNARIRKVTATGIISTVAGNGTEGFSGDGGAATGALLNGPHGVAVDSGGSLYIADYGNSRIRKVMPGGAKVSLVLTLSAGGAETSVTIGASETTRAGYAALTVNSGTAPCGTAVFSFKQSGVTVSEAGVPASPPTTRARLFIDYRSGVSGHGDAGTVDIDTGIAVVNFGSETADVVYALHSLGGTRITSARGTLPPGAHFARFIDQLKEVASGFNLPQDFPTSTGFGSLEISSDQPLSVVALREILNQRHEALFTTTPIADLTQPLRTDPIYFPQFVDGGGYTTALILLNTSTAVEAGMLQIFDDSGLPLAVNQVDGTADSSFRYSIPAGGVFRFQADGFPASARAGWVLLTPDAGTSTPVGAGVFSYSSGGTLVSESGIPAAVSTTHARVYVDLSRGHDTGLAIANPANTNADITIRAYQTDGITPIGTSQGPLQLPGNGHGAQFATELISGLPAGFTGVLDITSVTPFAALTLRSLNNERNDFLMTMFPIADADRAAPSPVVFPQIADGGGFVTEFIQLNAGGASKTTLSFFDNEGRQLAVGK